MGGVDGGWGEGLGEDFGSDAFFKSVEEFEGISRLPSVPRFRVPGSGWWRIS